MVANLHAVIVVLLVASIFAGCMNQTGDQEEPDQPVEPSVAERLFGDARIPIPDGNGTRDWLADFVAQYSPRVTGTPGDDAAEAFLVSELEALDFEVTVFRFAPGQGLATDGPIKAIVATRTGTETPDRWLAWGGHYDSSALLGPTIEGAYDNGSGTAMIIEIARMVAQLETNRTMAAILFNGEEEGLLASSAYTAWYEDSADYDIDLFLGFDMVGLGYPAPRHPLMAFSAAQYSVDIVPVLSAVAFDVLGLPRDGESVQVKGENTRNSDEAAFDGIGVPSARFAGLERAGDYWGYHELNDTMETIYAMAGPTQAEGMANYAVGLDHTARWATGTLMAFDRMPPIRS